MSGLIHAPAAVRREMSRGGHKIGNIVELTASQDILKKREIFYRAVKQTLKLSASGPVNTERAMLAAIRDLSQTKTTTDYTQNNDGLYLERWAKRWESEEGSFT